MWTMDAVMGAAGRARSLPLPTPEAERRRTMLVLAFALLAALALRLLYVTTPLGIDEGGLTFVARAWGAGGGSIYGAYWLDRPPLLMVLYQAGVVAGPLGIRGLGALAALALVTATTTVAQLVAGDRAARVAALLAAVLASSEAIDAVFTPAELLAAVPATASVGCLVAAHRRGEACWMLAAGLLAVSAALTKQSSVDAAAAGAALLVATAVRDHRLPVRWAGAYAAGAAIPLAGVAVWLLVAHVSVAELAYALVGFRVDALHALAASSRPPSVRVQELLLPGLTSGLFAALVLGLGGLFRLRGDRTLIVTLGAWLLAGAAGLLGGGSYWPHYLIQLVAPASVLAGAALAGSRWRILGAAIAAVAALGTIDAVGPTSANPRQRAALEAAGYVRTHAARGDTQWVMYARANLGYYTGLPSSYPYAWSLMVRAVPGASPQLVGLLNSHRRPTWVIGWQRANSWHLDPDGAVAHALVRHYRVVARVDGHAIYHRRSPR